MKREIRITRDGSPTLYLPELDEHYHSTHGAVQEARHVFIENGLRTFTNKDRILKSPSLFSSESKIFLFSFMTFFNSESFFIF
jgi:hypothetical protein